ncbi:MAG TPA: hypothetical protein VNY52_13090 [Solirubrobacteraceae bacterium]|nr:hypothetical protein [Solirubrobacteraceae bacterium]
MTPPPATAATARAPAVAPRRAPHPGRPARPPRAPSRPRRVSGPARRPARGESILPRPGLARPRVGQLVDRLLDRLIGGRAWIAVVAFALIGIVAMQLWIVKLGVGIGRALEHEGLLQRENSTLAVENSTLASGERVERLALAQGMTIAPPGALHFDTLQGPLDVRLAAAALAKPLQTSISSSTESTAPSAEVSAGASTTTGSETATSEASPQAAPATTASSAPAPESPTTPASTTEAPTSAPSTPTASATGGAAEAASAPAGPAGGTQAAPGG